MGTHSVIQRFQYKCSKRHEMTGRLILFLTGEWQRGVLGGADPACREVLCAVSALFWEVFDKRLGLKQN